MIKFFMFSLLNSLSKEVVEDINQRTVFKPEAEYMLFHLLELLPVYPPDYPRARSSRGGRADKPQHHDKGWNKMFINVDLTLLGNLCAREGGAVKLFQIRQALVSARVKLGERRCLETFWRTKGEVG